MQIEGGFGRQKRIGNKAGDKIDKEIDGAIAREQHLLEKRKIEEMYDLAAMSRSRPAVSNDLPEYIMENELVRVALHTAKDVDATDEEWLEFIEKLKKRMIPNNSRKNNFAAEDDE